MRIGIVGGGISGLMAAWLLDRDNEIFLFEHNSQLGGHARTVYVNNSPIELGFEFFNPTLFPCFTRLLTVLKVPTTSFELTSTFYTHERRCLVMPPFHGGKISWSFLRPQNLLTLLQLFYFMKKGKQFLKRRDDTITLERYMESLFLSASFKNNFLYPFFAAGWGPTIQDFKSFAAYDILKWVEETSLSLYPDLWSEVIHGASSYIALLKEQIVHGVIKTSTPIINITRDASGYALIEPDGTETIVDHIIMATDPQQACMLLKNIEQATAARSILSTIDCFPTVIAVHGDSRFMPENKSDWSVVNINYDGNEALITVHKPWKGSQPLFRSWITHKSHKLNRDMLPEPLYALEQFYHQKVTPAYFKAQRELTSIQGLHNIWFVGHYTHDIDSHESAVVSALNVAQRLAPESDRLALFLNYV